MPCHWCCSRYGRKAASIVCCCCCCCCCGLCWLVTATETNVANNNSNIARVHLSAGKTLAENLENVPDLKEGQMLIYPIDRPIKQTGHIQIMYGNLAPEGCVGKITGKEGLEFEGPARVFDSEESMLRAVEAGPQKLKVRKTQPQRS